MPDYAPALTALLDREPAPAGGTTSAEVDYQVGDTACRGYLARPAEASGPLPAVLVIHDWTGVNDYARMRCDMLARLGYLAFAGDVYGADVRPSEQEAPQVAAQYYPNPELWRARVAGGLERLLAEPDADATRTAAIGYCFGGSSVLQLARTGAEVGGVASFHGVLTPGADGEAERIRAKLLILHGAADPVTKADDVAAFTEQLRAADGLDWQFVTYSGALHAFTQPQANAPEFGAQYQAAAERRSWAALKLFLGEVFG